MNASDQVDRVALWDAINAYAVACGGSPDKHVYGNTSRMRAVSSIERLVEQKSLVTLPTHLQETIQEVIRSAWYEGCESEDRLNIDHFAGFSVARELLSEPRKVCVTCRSRLCDGEEDEICRECWDASIAQANATRIERQAKANQPGRTP